MQYTAQTFNLPLLTDISKTSIEAHIGLYEGYVKNFNAISVLIEDLLSDPTKNALAIAELRRRHAFEFDGMRLHELYFEQFEGGPQPQDQNSTLAQAITKHWGSPGAAVERVKQTGMMRGPGWSILYFNPTNKAFHMGFVGEQHQGHFATLPIILALDVWEHAYLLDHGTTGKDKYIDAFLKNINWSAVEKRFAHIPA